VYLVGNKLQPQLTSVADWGAFMAIENYRNWRNKVYDNCMFSFD